MPGTMTNQEFIDAARVLVRRGARARVVGLVARGGVSEVGCVAVVAVTFRGALQ